MEFTANNITLIVVGALTWLVFILGVAKFSKFYLLFTLYRRELDTNLTGMGSSMKKLQNSISEMILEQRRTNKLMLELIDNSKSGIGGNSSDDEGTEPQIEYQIPGAQAAESPFIFHGNESQLSQAPESEFIFHGDEDQHQ
ncbi:MAG: hypothetical protein WCI51_01925 [Lentisphaerota bacterium]